jgi:hypothetical protein
MENQTYVDAIQAQTQVLADLISQNKTAQKDQESLFANTLSELVKAVGGERVEKTSTATGHSGTLLHGPGGMFNTPGLSSALISTHVRSRGLGSLLPAFPSNEVVPYFGFITGFGAESGDEPTNPCDDAPTGYMKSGTLTAKFGHVARDTQTIRLPDTIKKINRSDFTDLTLINSLLNPDHVGVHMPANISESGILDMATQAEQVIAGVNMERKLHGDLLWNGDGTGANDTPGGGYVEYPGLDNQIVTAQVDAETNAAMAAADSLVLDFGYQDVATSDIVEFMEEAEDYNFNLAEDTGIGPVNGVLVMRPNAFRALTSVWPIQYNTQPEQAIIAGSEARVIIDARANVDQRDNMRNQLYLDLNGKRFSVVLDTGITEENNSTNPTDLDAYEYASSIYYIPLSVIGGLPVTYFEYLDYTLASPQEALISMAPKFWWTDGGRFLWSYDGQFTCFKLKMETDPRVVLRTPHLAWKIQDVKYSRLVNLRDPDPDNDYWVNGGVSIRNLSPTQYAAWL